ncbi:MAG TPA: heme-binding protein [Pseudomonadota bacterium]|nr:heme-binding protein [Xanthomonadales bacterium]HQW82675.1 heme-binding protein [Pseudomonadota bacterium]
MHGLHRQWGWMVFAIFIAGCSGSGNSGDPVGTSPPPAGTTDSGCTGSCANADSFLSVADVQKLIAQAVNEAQALNQPATIAVVDRVGNVLGVYRMTGARSTVTISSGRGVQGGLENIAIIPSELAAISKAVTGAYLSSEGNAFSTRTASQIVQEHFNPGEFGGPSGPLFGTQFSQFLCSDVINLPAPVLAGLFAPGSNVGVGPKSAPLGLSADPGGFPLYKGGTPVGGVGVVADGNYGLDLNVSDRDRDVDELIATAASFGFGAPLDRRGDRITVDGKTFRYSDVDFADLSRNPAQAPSYASLPASSGAVLNLFAFSDGTIQPGVAFGTPASGIRADSTDYPGLDAFVLVDPQNQPRFAPKAGAEAGGISAIEARELVRAGLAVANHTRAQIRTPFGTQARVGVVVVDTEGSILAFARTRDAPMFGIDVAVQKARSAAFFSSDIAETELAALPDAVYLNADGTPSSTRVDFGDVVDATQTFFAEPNLFASGQGLRAGPYALTPRALGNVSRPFFPDGIRGTANGPLSKPFANWSPFSDGLQFDLVNNQIAQILSAYLAADTTPILELRPEFGNAGCTRNLRLRNGIQIFPGAVPIYRGNDLVGAIGVSGDGIDQDDMVAALGLKNAAATLNTGLRHASPEMRSDRLQPQGVRLRYVQCPQAPFLDSNEQSVCEGL